MHENKAVQKGTPALRVLRQGQAAASSNRYERAKTYSPSVDTVHR